MWTGPTCAIVGQGGPLAARFGYDEEASRLREALRSAGPIAVVGRPGAGKSRLVRDEVDGVWCDLSRGRAGLAVALGLEPDADPRGAVARLDGPLILDGADALLDRLPAVLPPRLQIPVVITSRERPRLPGEREIRLDGLTHADAVAWLASAAPDAAPDVLAAIAERLEGLPLALELAAMRMAVLSAEELLARLDSALDVLDTAPRGGRSLRAVAEEAWSGLDEVERRVLATAAALPVPVDLPLLESLEPGGLDALQALVDRSLVRRVGVIGGRARFSVIVGLAELARPHAPPGPRIERALAARASGDLPRAHLDPRCHQRLQADRPAYLAHSGDRALDVAAAAGARGVLPVEEQARALDAVIAARPCAALHVLRVYLACLQRDAARAREAVERAGEVAGDGSLSLLPEGALDLEVARTHLTFAEPARAREIGMRVGNGRGLAIAATATDLQGELRAASELWRRAVERLEADGDESALTGALPVLASLETSFGRASSAARALERARDLAEAWGLPSRARRARVGLASARLDLGHAEEARQSLLALLPTLEPRLRPAALLYLASACRDLGDPDAARWLDEAERAPGVDRLFLRLARREPPRPDETRGRPRWLVELVELVAGTRQETPHILEDTTPAAWAAAVRATRAGDLEGSCAPGCPAPIPGRCARSTCARWPGRPTRGSTTTRGSPCGRRSSTPPRWRSWSETARCACEA